jgi:hypothetical protein
MLCWIGDSLGEENVIAPGGALALSLLKASAPVGSAGMVRAPPLAAIGGPFLGWPAAASRPLSLPGRAAA